MARIRSIHPKLWTTARFVSMSPLARLLAIALWTEADDQGVFEWDPDDIVLRLLPRETCDGSALLAEIAERDWIRKFEHEGRAYGAIRNFRKWQKPKYPSRTHHLPDELREYVQLPQPSPKSPPDLPQPSPKSPPGRRSLEGSRSTGEGDSTNKTRTNARARANRTTTTRNSRTVSEDDFSTIKTAYPKRDGSQPWNRARQAINARIREGTPLADMLAGTKRYSGWCDAKAKTGTEHVMQAATFFGPDRHFEQPWSYPGSQSFQELDPDRLTPRQAHFADLDPSMWFTSFDEPARKAWEALPDDDKREIIAMREGPRIEAIKALSRAEDPS